MVKRLKNKSYTIKELIAYYVLGYKKYIPNIEDTEEDALRVIIKNILDCAITVENVTSFIELDEKNLKDIKNKWKFNEDDLMAYATNIFYTLVYREENITEEQIVKELLSEIDAHHPRDEIKEADFIIDNLFIRKL